MVQVLLVEDDPDMRDVTAFALQRAGYGVLQAADGEQALARWEAAQPDLVLLDVELPRLDGFEVCRRIRAQAGTPIILLTGHAQEEQGAAGLLAGADAYVTKPFSARQLVSEIEAVLSRRARTPLAE